MHYTLYTIHYTLYTTQVGQLAKYVTFSIPKDEYVLSLALLENYETLLLELFGRNNSSSRGGRGGSEYSTYGTYSSNSDTNSVEYGTLLHPTSAVFTPHTRYLYSILDPLYQDQILVAVRFTISMLAQELCVYSGLVNSMHVSLRVKGYSVVHKERERWYEQREGLRRALSSGIGNNSNSGASVVGSVDSLSSLNSVSASVDNSGTLHTPTPPTAIPTTSPTTTSNTTPSTHNTPPPTVRTHYVTYGSDLTEGLQNLLLSARLAGITIEASDV